MSLLLIDAGGAREWVDVTGGMLLILIYFRYTVSSCCRVGSGDE